MFQERARAALKLMSERDNETLIPFKKNKQCKYSKRVLQIQFN